MAVRDRNLFAWQAYVITMSIVSVVLLLGMFFLWRGYSDASKNLEAAREKQLTSDQLFQEANGKVELLQAMMGYSAFTPEDMTEQLGNFADDPSMGPILDDYKKAMNLFARSVDDPSDKNLLKLPEYLLETIRARNEDMEANRLKTEQLANDLQATVQRETAARTAAEEAAKKAENDLAATRVALAKEVADVNQKRLETIAAFDANKAKFDAEIKDVQQKLATVTTENVGLSAKNTELQDKLNELIKPDFASPQGRVVRVANGSRRVWIDLGKDDGVRPGVVFSVLDVDTVNTSEAKPKAKVVVTQVLSERMCIAEAIDLDYGNIIVSEDLVYSPAWRPGRKVGFALVGEMDINGDGKDDIQQVRELIQIAGGTIDAEKTASNEAGRIDYNTTWLVLGTDLTLSETDSDLQRAQRQAKAKAYAEFIKVGDRNGVQKISLDKLMGYLKTNSSDRTVPLGNRTNSKDFPITSPTRPPVSDGKVSEIFTPRPGPK